jgi:hypothetical protein
MLWGGLCGFWIISPLLINDYLLGGDKQYEDGALYHSNVFNILFPVSIEFYNNNFIQFYVMECTLMLYNLYALILFDIFIVPLFMTIFIQLKTINMAYKSIGYHSSSMDYEGILQTVAFKNRTHLISNPKKVGRQKPHNLWIAR